MSVRLHFDLQHAVYYGELECDDVAVLGLHCLYSELIFVDQNRIKETRIEIILVYKGVVAIGTRSVIGT